MIIARSITAKLGGGGGGAGANTAIKRGVLI